MGSDNMLIVTYVTYKDKIKQKSPWYPMGIFVYIAGAGIAPALQGSFCTLYF